jgi:extradiol dioxygenase
MTTEICGLGYVGFDTPNVDAWIDFGPRVLGMSLAPSQPDGTVRLRYDDYHHRIALHPAPEHRLAYIGWETANHGDLDIVATRLNDAGFDIEEGDDETCTSRVVQRLIRFVDPSGFNHEVFFGAGYRLRSFHPGRKHGGFVTGNQGMGHIVLLVPDLAPALDLFENVLTEGGPPRRGNRFAGAFLRCNERHHSIAFVQYPGIRGVHHVYVECNDLTDVGVALDLAEANHHPISMTLGQHLGDDAISFYVRTPGGFDIEYGYGSLRVDDSFVAGRSFFGHGEMWGHVRLSDSLPDTIDVLDPAGLELVRKVLLKRV